MIIQLPDPLEWGIVLHNIYYAIGGFHERI